MLIPSFFNKLINIKYSIDVPIIEIIIEIAKFCLIFNRIGKIIKNAKDGMVNKIVPYDKSITF